MRTKIVRGRNDGVVLGDIWCLPDVRNRGFAMCLAAWFILAGQDRRAYRRLQDCECWRGGESSN